MNEGNTPNTPGDLPEDSSLNFDEGSSFEEMKVEDRRGASLTLTEESDTRSERSASMAMANRSLADALQATYRILQVVMVVLVGLFILNGFQSVEESESGVATRFGAIVQTDLEPGFHFAWPRPFGSVEKVDVSTVRVSISDRFYPFREERQRALDFTQLGRGTGTLRPGRDGSLITADRSLAHAQFEVSYVRSSPSEFLENVHPEFEADIVQSAIHAAIVQVAAEIQIDDLLRRSAAVSEQEGGSASARTGFIESRIQRITQDNLNRIGGTSTDGLPVGAGINITSVQLTQAYPPLPVVERFNEVNNAVSQAESESQNARRERTDLLSAAAGPAAETMLQLIDNYEAYTDLGRAEDAERVLQTMFAVIDGQYASAPLQIENPLTGEPITGPGGEPRDFGSVVVRGQVATQIREAELYRNEVVSKARREEGRFEIALEQYRANPGFFVADRWSNAMIQLNNNSFVERFMVPDGSNQIELLLNDDPEIARRAERARNQRDAEAARQRADDRYR